MFQQLTGMEKVTPNLLTKSQHSWYHIAQSVSTMPTTREQRNQGSMVPFFLSLYWWTDNENPDCNSLQEILPTVHMLSYTPPSTLNSCHWFKIPAISNSLQIILNCFPQILPPTTQVKSLLCVKSKSLSLQQQCCPWAYLGIMNQRTSLISGDATWVSLGMHSSHC